MLPTEGRAALACFDKATGGYRSPGISQFGEYPSQMELTTAEPTAKTFPALGGKDTTGGIIFQYRKKLLRAQLDVDLIESVPIGLEEEIEKIGKFHFSFV